jgi:hypothetical protein
MAVVPRKRFYVQSKLASEQMLMWIVRKISNDRLAWAIVSDFAAKFCSLKRSINSKQNRNNSCRMKLLYEF